MPSTFDLSYFYFSYFLPSFLPFTFIYLFSVFSGLEFRRPGYDFHLEHIVNNNNNNNNS